MIRDRDRIYGTVVTRRLRAMGIRDKPTAPASPWQKRLCRTAGWLDPARVFGPRHRLGRSTFAPSSEILRRLLQLRQDASVFAQGYAGFSACSAIRAHNFTCPRWRTSPSILPGLRFSVHTGFSFIGNARSLPSRPFRRLPSPLEVRGYRNVTDTSFSPGRQVSYVHDARAARAQRALAMELFQAV
jgi:hypothetical protein